MQHLSQQGTESRLPPPGQVLERLRRRRHIDRMITDWDTTPGKLRVTMVVLVLGVLLSGGIGAYTADVRADATRNIAERIEPLNAEVTTLYRSLAAADATVTSGFLAGSVEPSEVRARYDRQVATATSRLAQAGAQAGDDLVTADRIADIAAQLPVYTGLIERARANNRQGLPLGVAYLRRASELMQSSILPEAQELQRRQAARLDEAYRRAGPVPVLALTACAVSLAGLIWAQLFLFQRTHRIFNIGLVAATGTVLVGLLWWTVTGVISAGYLQSSRGHSQSVSDALGPAQIAALQARATESLSLVARNGAATEDDFDAQLQLLARNKGAGGALGAARQFATDQGDTNQEGEKLVETAISAAVGYQEAHKEVVRRLGEGGEYRQAVDAALGAGASTFNRLGSALAGAVYHERTEFKSDIARAQRWLTGLTVGTGGLALAAAVGIALGIRRRLEEYR
ncbi:MAG: hypothetical protein M3R66_10430 [Actinomycetota bacterium]|nr:hypothetical protein [Actinomycetota bacterium]